MKLALTALMLVILASAGCKGCDDTTSQNNQNNTLPPGCADADEDGYALGRDCVMSTDCNDTDAAINPGAEEICGDDVDNNCDGNVDDVCDTACTPGATRACGRDEGACTAGAQTCGGDGTWGDCDGQGPVSETCNGVDDDCDGEVDENGDQLCDDGLVCNGTSVCQDGACTTPELPDCSALDGPCSQGMCSEKDRGCRVFPRENGSPCDDGNFCTDNGVCNAGECVTTPRDCSGEDDACNVGVCDEAADACVKQPVSDGTTCDDGEFCTVNDTCTAGTCGGGARDCTAAADQCNTGVCDEAADTCVPMPLPNDTPCDDGAYCNVGETCQAGVCGGGAARDCSASGGSCRTGSCNEATDSCDGPPVADGTPCDDSMYCTVNDSCVAGTCMGGPPRNCSAQDGVCRVGTCNESINQCVSSPAANGSPCDDGQFCTTGETCNAGACTGTPRDCTSAANACNTGSCSEAMDACVPVPRSDGTACPDTLFCTVMEQCQAGTCSTQPRDCAAQTDQCNTGTCDDTADACVPSPRPNGTVCDDGQFCTGPAGDTCQFGACLAGPARDCSGATMGDACLTGVCDENANMCMAEATMPPPASCCNVMVDADLDGSNECMDCDDTNGAVRPGAMEFCNGVDDDCDGMIDEDFDADGDGYATCGDDPSIRDCNDMNPNVNPGTLENCGPMNTGNGIDDDCDGYIDEGCNPCTNTDVDGDGRSECDGDCDDNDPSMYPGAPELCDGKDNDCNIFTTPNCGVSDRCNHDLDGNFGNDPDVCEDDMLCACLLQGRNCTGNWRCTSFCNWSEDGPLGDGCQPDQTCALDLTNSANVHGCNVNTDPPGDLLGGAICGRDSDCRSLQCDRRATGPNGQFCTDLCTSDNRCAPGASCRLFHNPQSGATPANADGICWANSLLTGATSIGAACTSDTSCSRRACVTDPNDASRYCTGICCSDSDCPSNYTCSFQGIAQQARASASTIYVAAADVDAPNCTSNAQCAGEGGVCNNDGKCTYPLYVTTGQCVKDVPGQGTRRGGQACTANSQCASNFCERDLGVCIEPCCADSTCPTGLACELATVQTKVDQATTARVCLSFSTDDTLERQ